MSAIEIHPAAESAANGPSATTPAQDDLASLRDLTAALTSETRDYKRAAREAAYDREEQKQRINGEVSRLASLIDTVLRELRASGVAANAQTAADDGIHRLDILVETALLHVRRVRQGWEVTDQTQAANITLTDTAAVLAHLKGVAHQEVARQLEEIRAKAADLARAREAELW